MKKTDVLKFLIVINLLAIVLIVWFAWIQDPKSVLEDTPEIKVETIKLESMENFKEPLQEEITKQKKPEKKEKKVIKKPEKKVIKMAKKKKPEKKEVVPEKTSKVCIYGLLSDKYTEPSLKFDTANPGNVDGGYLGAWGSAQVKGGIPDTYNDPPSSLKVACVGGWGGVWFQFGFDPKGSPGEAMERDMSLYGKYIRFDMKSDGEVIVGMEWWDEIAQNKDSADIKIKRDLKFPTDNKWHSVKIEFTKIRGKNYGHSINFKKIKLPVSFCGENVTFYIDNLRWEK